MLEIMQKQEAPMGVDSPQLISWILAQKFAKICLH